MPEHHDTTSQNTDPLQVPGLKVEPPPSRFVDSPYLVPFDGSFQISSIGTTPPPGAPTGKDAKKLHQKLAKEIGDLQDILYAQDRYGVLTKLQGMDTAGKGGMIKALTRNVEAAGSQVYSFKKPTAKELDYPAFHRTKKLSAARGIMTFYDRSDYEEVLVIRVHPEYLKGQRIPDLPAVDDIWPQRYDALRSEERDLAYSGIVVAKIWLNTSKTEQAAQLLERIDDPAKRWKLSPSDLSERKLWDKYIEAAELAMRYTSAPWAPWYCIPGDDKQYARYIAADIMVRTMQGLNLEYPELSSEDFGEIQGFREELLREVKKGQKKK